jgi:hypothetical protein
MYLGVMSISLSLIGFSPLPDHPKTPNCPESPHLHLSRINKIMFLQPHHQISLVSCLGFSQVILWLNHSIPATNPAKAAGPGRPNARVGAMGSTTSARQPATFHVWLQ